MKTITKISLLICFLASGIVVNAQYIPKKRLTSDIRAGINLAEMDIKGANMYKEVKLGVNLGVNINYKFLGNMQFQTGFLITKKGLKKHINTLDRQPVVTVEYDEHNNTTGNYIQMPFNLGYELYTSRLFAFNINAGAYIAYGYKGKGTYAIRRTTTNTYEDEPLIERSEGEYESFTPERWKRLDYGLNANIGFVYDIYSFCVSYEYGLYNISRTNPELRNRNMSAAIGFRF
ncbi:MAG: PorT family protein [Prevotella sp.]|jgi:hypothetical protein|nr:PorT family protein [Prevotella sp.]